MRRSRTSTDTLTPSLSSWAKFQRASRSLLLTAALLVFAGAGAANAQGLRVAWDHCGDAGSANKTFPCSTSSGSDTVVISFFSPYNLPKFRQAGIFMHVCFAANVVPDWWQVVLGEGSCRLGALTAVAPSLSDNCSSIWDPGSGPIQSVSLIGGTTLNGFRFYVDVAAADTSRAPNLVAGQEFELARLVLDHTRSAGPGACVGCSIGASIGADFVWFSQTDGQAVGTSGGAYVTWQDASLICRAITPVKNRTWGQLKSMYR